MKYFYYILNITLVIAITMLLFIDVDNKEISISKDYKILNTSVFTGKKILIDKAETTTGLADTKQEETTTNIVDESLTSLENNVSNNLVSAGIISDTLETQVGSMSAYGPDCAGCSGRLGAGFDARSGAYTYTDSTYGTVRIVAGDSSYPYGSIVRVKGSKLGEFYAIILDRGGAIGIGKRFMYDLLFPNEATALSYGTEYNLTFEIVRYGY